MSMEFSKMDEARNNPGEEMQSKLSTHYLEDVWS